MFLQDHPWPSEKTMNSMATWMMSIPQPRDHRDQLTLQIFAVLFLGMKNNLPR